MTKEAKIKMEKEIEKLTKQFYFNYGHTPDREAFFSVALPEFSEKVFERDVDLNKEVRDFIDEYKKKELGGFNATYGNLYHWLVELAAEILGVDVFELKNSVVYK
jgi:hypothetical protein